MTIEDKQLLNTFENQLRHFIYLHDELKQENAKLKKLLEEEKNKNLVLQAEFDTLNENYTNMKSAAVIDLTGSDVRETKKKLNKLVREVDQCIALLNE